MNKKRLLVFVSILISIALAILFIPVNSAAGTGGNCCLNPPNYQSDDDYFCQSSTPQQCCGEDTCPDSIFVEDRSCDDLGCFDEGCCVNECETLTRINCGNGTFYPDIYFCSDVDTSPCAEGCCYQVMPDGLPWPLAPATRQECESLKEEKEPLGWEVRFHEGEEFKYSCDESLSNGYLGSLRGNIIDSDTDAIIPASLNPVIRVYGFTLRPTTGEFFYNNNLPIGEQSIIAYAEGYHKLVLRGIQILPGQTTLQNVSLVKDNTAPITIEGKVTDAEDSRSIQGVTVHFFQTSKSIITDKIGEYQLEIPSSEITAGIYTIQAYKAGYQTKSTEITLKGQPGEYIQVNFNLPREINKVVCGDGKVEGDENCEPPGQPDACGRGISCGQDCKCPTSCSDVGGTCADFAFQCEDSGGNPIDVFRNSCRSEKNIVFNQYVCCDGDVDEIISCMMGSGEEARSINQTGFGLDVSGKICKCGPDMFIDARDEVNGTNYCCFEEGEYLIKNESCQPSGQLTGFVRNETNNGTGIVGAMVRIKQTGEFGLTKEFLAGEYIIENIPPGVKSVEVIKEGYVPLVVNGIEIISGLQAVKDFILHLDKCQNITLYSFTATSVKGVLNVNLSWNTNCKENIRVENGFALLRNGKTIALLDKEKRSYLDTDDELEWSTNYTYVLKARDKLTGNFTSEIKTDIVTGMKFCENIMASEEFCVSNACFGGNCTRENIISKVNESLTVRAECDGTNNIILADGGDRYANCTRLSNSSICVNPSYGVTYCRVADECEKLGISPSAPSGNVLGSYYNDYYDQLNCLVDESKIPPEDKRFCYYDYWHWDEEPYTNTNKCLRCSFDEFCYDYQSEDACLTDSCGYGNKYGGDCKWQDGYYGELGKGICYYEGYNGTDYCNLCNKNNSVFYNTHCTAQVCDMLGACISNADNTSCIGCDAGASCDLFKDELSCTGATKGNGENFQFTGEPQASGMSCGSSTKFAWSTDACDFGLCKWFEGYCAKDANDDDVPDCSGSEECEKDTLAPVTTFKEKPTYISTKSNKIVFQTDDAEAQTFYCLTEHNTVCCPDEGLGNGTLMIPNYRYNLENFEGYKTLMYYSIDPYRNPEIINTEEVFIDTRPPVMNLEIKTEDYTYDNRKSNIRIKLSIDEHSRCSDSITDMDTYSSNVFKSIILDEGETAQEMSVGLEDAVYKYEITCTDDYQNEVKQTHYIDLDRVKLINGKSPHRTTLNNGNLNMWITTEKQNFYCYYKFTAPVQGASFIQFNDVGSGIKVVGGTHDGDYIYTATGANVRNLAAGTYNALVSCYDKPMTQGGAEVDSTNLIFTIDTIPPTTTLQVDQGGVLVAFDPSSFYKDPKFVLTCKDELQGPPEEFGCKELSYCLNGENCGEESYSQETERDVLITGDTGSYYLCFKSRDNGSNEEMMQCQDILLNHDPPEIRITYPADTGSTGEQRVMLTGYWQDANMNNLYVVWKDKDNKKNDKTIDITPGVSTFSADIGLWHGANIITVIGYDTTGNRGEDSIVFYYDTNPPSISNVLIKDLTGKLYVENTQFKSDIEYGITAEFSLKVNDFMYSDVNDSRTDDIKSVSLKIMDEAGDEILQEHILDYTIDTGEENIMSTIYSKQIDSSSLIVGKYIASYEAADKHGYKATYEQSFSIKDTTAPWFNITVLGVSDDEALGYGDYDVKVVASEPLDPEGVIKLEYMFGEQDDFIEITRVNGREIDGIIHIDIDDGIYYKLDDVEAKFVVQARDINGIVGEKIISGELFHIDTTGPKAPQIFNPATEKAYTSNNPFIITGSSYQGDREEWVGGEKIIIMYNTESDSKFDPGWQKGETISYSKPTAGPYVWEIAKHQAFSVEAGGENNKIFVYDPTSVMDKGNYLEFGENTRQNNGFYKIIARNNLAGGWKEVVLSPALEEDIKTTQDIFIWGQEGPKGWWRYQLPITSDRTYLYSYGEDKLGNNGTETKVYTIILDSTVPRFSEETPSDGSVSANKGTEISVKIDGTGSTIEEYSMSINDIKIGDANLISLDNENQYLLTYEPNTDLSDGKYFVDVTAEDLGGGRNSYSWRFTINSTAPSDPVIIPSGKIKENMPGLTVRFSNSETIELLEMKLTYNDEEVSLIDNGRVSNTFSYSLNKALQEGEHDVYVKARKQLMPGKFGVNGEWTEKFTVDTKPPVIENLPDRKTSSEFPAEINFKTDESAKCKYDFGDMPYQDMKYEIGLEYAESHDMVVAAFRRGEKRIFIRCEDEIHNMMTSSDFIDLEMDYDSLKAPVIYIPSEEVTYVNQDKYKIIGSTFGGNIDKWAPNVNVAVLVSTLGRNIYAYFTSYYGTKSFGNDFAVIWDYNVYEPFSNDLSSIVLNDADNLIQPGKFISFEDNIREDYQFYKVVNKTFMTEVLGKRYYRLALDKKLEGGISGNQNILIYNNPAPPGYFEVEIPLKLGENHFYAQAIDDFNFLGDLSGIYTLVYDPELPEISGMLPVNNTISNDVKSEISFMADGTFSDVEEVVFLVDGNEVKYSKELIADNKYKITYKNSKDWAEGQHDINVRIKDMAGNEISTAWGFLIDLDVPPMPDIRPAGYTNDNTPLMRYLFNYAGTINPTYTAVSALEYERVFTDNLVKTGQNQWQFDYGTGTGQLVDGLYYNNIKATKKLNEWLYSDEGSWFKEFTVDTVPPTVVDYPEAVHPTAMPVTFTIRTDEDAICKYDQDDKSYDTMSHVDEAEYQKLHEIKAYLSTKDNVVLYIRCADEAGNKMLSSVQVDIKFESDIAECSDGLDNDGDDIIDYPNDPGCESAGDDSETDPSPGDEKECSDGLDNDGDNLYDYPDDPGCSAAGDDDEADMAQCNDGADNDGDGLVDYPYDPDCQDESDDNERYSSVPACNDGVDNDGDSLIDYPNDPGCTSAGDDSEMEQSLPECSNDKDDDGDGLKDYPDDPGCYAAGDDNENDVPECSDKIDNDGDGYIDYPFEPDCESKDDDNEDNLPQCRDNEDNDGDGLIDYGEDPDCTSTEDNDEEEHDLPECSDKKDNDVPLDGLIDFPWDPDCGSAGDDSEGFESQCNDGIDNDKDGLTDMNDPGCSSTEDNNEIEDDPNEPAACSDGRDNDHDNKIDFPLDPGCESAGDDSEVNPPPEELPECGDTVDNDGDGLADYPNDPGCYAAGDDNEIDEALCSDGLDNDGDTLIDYPFDPGCENADDTSEIDPPPGEKPICSDGVDNDGDKLVDFPNDPGCVSASDGDETDPPPGEMPECANKDDDDGDGLIDYPADPGCYAASDDNEIDIPECDDRIDNDNDGITDFPFDPGCSSKEDNNEIDSDIVTLPICSDGVDNDGDGLIDFPDDLGCESAGDTSEIDMPACNDRMDNDGDGLVDYLFDPGCRTVNDDDETNPAQNKMPACNDTIDNDVPPDGLIDFPDDPGCEAAGDSSETDPTKPTKCYDSIDNDGDGLIDFPNDPGCYATGDDDEEDIPSCYDRIDNDGDGLIDFPNDPGCENELDNTEEDDSIGAPKKCSDGVDNDGDDLLDFPDDPGCESAGDDSEIDPNPGDEKECSDNVDNDGDGLIDYPNDPGCYAAGDDDEDDIAQCNDGVDNDGDNLIDYPNDPGCYSVYDDNEYEGAASTQCDDGADNDNDGIIDFPDDPGCESAGDDSEFDPAPGEEKECSDKIDNEDAEDIIADYPNDPGCYAAGDDDETDVAACDDGVDNDDDGLVDYPNDPGCTSILDDDEYNEHSLMPIPELVVLIPSEGEAVSSSKITISGIYAKATEIRVYVNGKLSKSLKNLEFSTDQEDFIVESVYLPNKQSTSDGVNIIDVVAENEDGEYVYTINVIYDNVGPGIILISPTSGLSAISQPTVKVKTNEYARCTLEYTPASGIELSPLVMSTSGGLTHSVFLEEKIKRDKKTKIKVTCVDSLDHETYEYFYLEVVASKPKILELNLYGAMKVKEGEYLLLSSTNTSIRLVANESVRCKYGVGDTNYETMQKFPGFDSDDDDVKFTQIHETETIELEDKKDYKITVICESKVEAMSDPYTVKLEIDMFRPIQISNIYPSEYTGAHEPVIKFQTYREAACSIASLDDPDNYAGGLLKDGAFVDLKRIIRDQIYNYSLDISDISEAILPLADNKSYTFTIACRSEKQGINSSNKTFSFTTDFILRAPTILYPETGLLTNDSNLTVSGVSEANSIIELYIEDVFLGRNYTANGYFTFDALLQEEMEGIVKVEVINTDKAGNKNFSIVYIRYTATGPKVLGTIPASGDIASTVTKITALIETDKGIGLDFYKTKISLFNLKDGETNIEGEKILFGSDENMHEIRLKLPNPLSNGVYKLTVLAIDELNRTGGKTVTFTVDDSAPTITLQSPYDSTLPLIERYPFKTNELNIRFAGYVSTEHIPNQNTFVIDGTSMKETIDDEFDFSLGPFSNSNAGYNFTITSTNSLGAVGKLKGSFFIDVMGPKAIITVE